MTAGVRSSGERVGAIVVSLNTDRGWRAPARAASLAARAHCWRVAPPCRGDYGLTGPRCHGVCFTVARYFPALGSAPPSLPELVGAHFRQDAVEVEQAADHELAEDQAEEERQGAAEAGEAGVAEDHQL